MAYKLFGLKIPIFSNGYGNIVSPDAHIAKHYGEGWILEGERIIDGYTPINMTVFQAKKHCVLTSLVTILSYYRENGLNKIPRDKNELFYAIRNFASKQGLYTSILGVNVFTIGILTKKVFRHFGYRVGVKNKIYLNKNPKGTEYAVEEIENGRPFIISFSGGNYQNHSTTCYGYRIYKKGHEKKIYLILNDNWSEIKKYVDCSQLGSLKTTYYGICRIFP